MHPTKPGRWILAAAAAAFLAACASGTPQRAPAPTLPEWVSVRNAIIVVDPDAAPAVRHAAEDLRDFLKEAAGGEALLIVAQDGQKLPKGKPILNIRVVPALDDGRFDFTPPPAPAEAYRLQAERAAVYQIMGSDIRGTVHAVMSLQQRIRLENSDALLSGIINETGAPRFRRRGVYAHQHWAFNRPYALRSWSPEDWKRYVDLLGHLRYNLLQLWTMEGICPHPLSEADRRALRRYPSAIDHAHAAWGMEVWPGECGNNIAEDDKGQPFEAREYFDVEVLRNPGDPNQLADILRHRRNMYETVNNGDGYWIIDSDPGGWPESKPSEYVDIFLGNRKLLDEIHPRGREIPLVYWMWVGWWGEKMPADRRPASWRAVLADMKERLPEPWFVHACWPQHLEAVKEAGLTEKAMFFPYGVGEHEPSAPYTTIQFDLIRKAIRAGVDAGPLLGVQVNFQTPIVQLPNLYYFSRCAWDPKDVETPDDVVLRDLARQILPRHEQALADAWILLAAKPEATPGVARACLESAVALKAVVASGDPGPLGPLGRHLIPDAMQVARDLATRMRVRGLAFLAADAIRREDRAASERFVLLYLRECLRWQRTTGFHNNGAVTGWELPLVREPWMEWLKKDYDGCVAMLLRARGRLIAEGFDLAILDRALQQTFEVVTAQFLGPDAGFVRAWRVIGPFDAPGGGGLDRHFIEEPGVAPGDVLAAPAGRDLKWTPVNAATPGILFHEMFPNVNGAVAYAATAVESDADRIVEVRVGSDDGIKVWINGAEVFRNAVQRGAAVDQDRFPATLRKGWNTVLVKVDQGGGAWSFYLRFTDAQGKGMTLNVSSDK